MLTAMTDEDWTIVLRVFAASRSRRSNRGQQDSRKFLEALHYFVVHNITWRALPEMAVFFCTSFSTSGSGIAQCPNFSGRARQVIL